MASSAASSAATSAAASAAASAAPTVTTEVPEKSEAAGTEEDPEYGKVQIPKVEDPHMTKTIEGLYESTNLNLCCGIVGATIAIVVVVVAFIFALSAQKGRFIFFKLPDLRKLVKNKKA